MTNLKSLQLLETLEVLKENFTSDIAKEVFNYMEGYGNEWYIALKDICNSGCQSGTVGSLVYYNQSSKFHDEHEDEIDNIIENYIWGTGLTISEIFKDINIWEITLLKNYKSWFAFEYVAGEIMDFIHDSDNGLIE